MGFALRKIPHNVLIRTKPSPACFLIPRQPQEKFDVPSNGCNAAVCEVCGFYFMQNLEAYNALSEHLARRAFAEQASLDLVGFETLLAQLATALKLRGLKKNFTPFSITLGAGVCVAAITIGLWWSKRSRV